MGVVVIVIVIVIVTGGKQSQLLALDLGLGWSLTKTINLIDVIYNKWQTIVPH